MSILSISILSTDAAYYSPLQEIFDDDLSKSPVHCTVISTKETRVQAFSTYSTI